MSIRQAATLRTWLALTMLIAFAVGSQRCTLGALGVGGAMRCLAIPGEAAAGAPADRPGDCCHPSGAETGEDAPTRSCCIDAAPVPSALALDVDAASIPLIVAVAIVLEAPETPPAAVDVEPDESPPDPHEVSSLLSRAPPRA
jgi:hypothetical protein